MTICAFEIEASWKAFLDEELHKPYMVELAAFVEEERRGPHPIYPARELVFNAFRLTPFHEVKVVIVGQDPYHGPGQAHGLSFSVPEGVPPPPSLKNIFKELVEDVGIPYPQTGCLIPWAKQGVLLLNATLTVRQGQPLSHNGRGWERFTDAAIASLGKREEPVIFVLWGRYAKEKVAHINTISQGGKHRILTAAHPSPFSANNGFFGCRHFSQINQILTSWGKKSIEWQL